MRIEIGFKVLVNNSCNATGMIITLMIIILIILMLNTMYYGAVIMTNSLREFIWFIDVVWPRTCPGRTSLKIIPALYKPAYRPLQGTGGGVQVAQDIYLAKDGGGRSAPI